MIELEFWFTQFGVQIQKYASRKIVTRDVLGVGAAEPSRFGWTYQPPPINTKLCQMPLHLA
jgi:hypothetical protein